MEFATEKLNQLYDNVYYFGEKCVPKSDQKVQVRKLETLRIDTQKPTFCGHQPQTDTAEKDIELTRPF